MEGRRTGGRPPGRQRPAQTQTRRPTQPPRRQELLDNGTAAPTQPASARTPNRCANRSGARRRGGTVAGLNESLLRELFATPPPDFVAARNEVVKALRKEKARDDATAVAALRRPGWDEWSLNAVAASDPDVVTGFVEAAAEVRDAQAAAIEGRDGPDIRSALRDLRDRSADLVRLADSALDGVGRQAAAGEINARLSKVAASDVAAAQLVAGILGSGDAAPNELFADLQPAPARATPAKPATKAAKATKATKATKEPATEASSTTTEPKPTAAEERAARAEAARRKEALVEANRVHAAAVKARHRADAGREKATAAVERARGALAEAEATAADAQRELDDAVAAEDAAADAVEAARAAVDAGDQT
jgi:hypothetical protein